MIWSMTPDGKISYASPEWARFTGQPAVEALDYGWLKMVHPDDVTTTIDAFQQACASVTTFTVRYRLRHRDGHYVPVIVGAAPSLSPIDGAFLGYLGALNELPDDRVETASSRIGAFDPHKSTPSTAPRTPVDIVADHLLIARATAQVAGEERLLASLDFAISEVMRRLGHVMVPTAQ